MCMKNAPNSEKQNMNMYNRGLVRHFKLWVLTYLSVYTTISIDRSRTTRIYFSSPLIGVVWVL